jgi:negative regulator of sigma E activity
MQCEDIELILEQEGLGVFPEEARAHLSECAGCRSYVADLTSIVDVARKLPTEIAPPERVWVSLRSQLEAEGIIRTLVAPAPAETQSAGWWQSIHAFFSNRVLATATVGILIVAAAVFEIGRDRALNDSPRTPVAHEITLPPPITESGGKQQTQPAPGPVNSPAPSSFTAPAEFASTAQALDDQEPVATGMIASSNSSIDASLRDNLKKVNEFIADCERHLKEQPQDELTREYLSAAYQQKAELLSAIIERGRSIN